MAKQQIYLPFGHGQIGIGPGISHNHDLNKDFPSVSLEVFNEPHEIGEDLTGKEGEFKVVLVFETPDGIDMLIKALNDCKHPRRIKNRLKKLNK